MSREGGDANAPHESAGEPAITPRTIISAFPTSTPSEPTNTTPTSASRESLPPGEGNLSPGRAGLSRSQTAALVTASASVLLETARAREHSEAEGPGPRRREPHSPQDSWNQGKQEIIVIRKSAKSRQIIAIRKSACLSVCWFGRLIAWARQYTHRCKAHAFRDEEGDGYTNTEQDTNTRQDVAGSWAPNLVCDERCELGGRLRISGAEHQRHGHAHGHAILLGREGRNQPDL